MGNKRYKGLPDQGVGRLVSWVPDTDFESGGYYEQSAVSKKDQTKVRIPRDLIDTLRQQLIKQGHLSYAKAQQLPNNKVVLYYLFDALENKDWGDELKKAFDSQHDQPLHQVMKRQADLKTQDQYYGYSDRELIQSTLKKVDELQQVHDLTNRRHQQEYARELAMQYGVQRGLAWLIADRSATPPFNTTELSDKLKNGTKGFVANLNADRLTQFIDLLTQLGQHDITREKEKRR